MKASPRTMACIVLFLCSALAPLFPANAQTPPTYPELFVNPPQTEQLTQADLPNLSRLVVLESIAMFSNVTSELYEIREDHRLQNLIRELVVRGRPIQRGRFPLPNPRRASGRGPAHFPGRRGRL